MKNIRYIALALCFCMLLPMFAACGGGVGEITTDNSEVKTEETSGEIATDDLGGENTTEEISECPSESQTNAETDGSEKVTEPVSEDTEEETTEKITEKITEKETEEMITDVMVGEVLDAPYALDFSVSRVFADDMVVQRGEHIRVWGFADPSQNGKKVSGEFKGMFAEAIIENGEWCITFGARLEADTVGAEMKIYTDTKTVTFKDVLVGDVYMVVGQSNAQYELATLLDNLHLIGESATENPDPNSIIRLLSRTTNDTEGYPQGGTTEVCPDLIGEKTWTKTTYADTMAFSALGYYFAKEIVERTNGEIPIGMIEMGFSGRPMGCFLPNEVAEAMGADYIDEATGLLVSNGVNAWPGTGRYVYNHHMYPFEKFAIAGFIWYQGESNNSLEEAKKYNETFSAYIEYMRGTHNLVNRDFPVFVVEFPSIYPMPAKYSGEWHFMELGVIRSYLSTIPTVLDNSYVAVSGDLWEHSEYFNSLHPLCKESQALRLADLAEAVIYGGKTLDEATGPIFESFEISKDGLSATVTFSNVGDGLATADGGVDVKGFEVYLARFAALYTETPKSVKITAKNQITITHDKPIKGFAYNAQSTYFYGKEINLCNSFGNPAAAFTTDYGPFELDREYTYADVVKATKVTGSSLDAVSVDGTMIDRNSGISVKSSAETVAFSGWIGFKVGIMVFGYSVDGGDPVLTSVPRIPEQAVYNAGGKYAQRYYIEINIDDLSAGEHTIELIALIDGGDGTPQRFSTQTVTVTE